jgi:hypothetical protein
MGTNTMMEYIFVDAYRRDKFVESATGLDVACDSRNDNMGLVVEVPEGLADDLVDNLEARYGELQDEQSELMSQSEGGLKKLAGFKLILPDGQISMVPLQPDTANRLLASFSPEQIQVLFDTVASALDSKQSSVRNLAVGQA